MLVIPDMHDVFAISRIQATILMAVPSPSIENLQYTDRSVSANQLCMDIVLAYASLSP